MNRKYDKWLRTQISALIESQHEVVSSEPFDFNAATPFKIKNQLYNPIVSQNTSKEVKKNRNQPEYVSQFLIKQKIPAGLVIECGVWRGEMIHRFATLQPDKIIYGFDSFEGFPPGEEEEWNCPEFHLVGLPPILCDNIILTKGWFKDTLPEFLKTQNQKIAFIVIDCDIYASTRDVLHAIKDYITDETIICLDDALHYAGFKNHQMKALYEFCRDFGYSTKWICYRGEMATMQQIEERVGEEWNYRKQFRWRNLNNYSDCALYLIKEHE